MLNRRHSLFLAFSLLLCLFAKATHNRAGEITYKRIAPFTEVVGTRTVHVYWYSITVVMYTDHGPQIADRCQDTIHFGDGTQSVIWRSNFPGSLTGCQCGINPLDGKAVGCGSIMITTPDYTVKQNYYTTIHQYPGPGDYTIRMYDPNRNANVINIKNSVSQPFYIESKLIIRTFTGANSSPIFAFAPIDRACQDVCFEHNPGAYDPDGDSLSYEITTSRGQNGQTVSGYFYPETGDGGTFGIHPTTGLLRWCSPQTQGEYNIAFIVKEWRKNTNGVFEMIGYVLRDMQVIVKVCDLNSPPVISDVTETCVVAGSQITQTFTVSDPNKGDGLTVTGGGGPFNGPLPLATLSPTTTSTSSLIAPSFVVNFQWQTNCDHIRKQPYAATIKATDDHPKSIQLVTFNTFNIRVVPPSVKNVTATPAGSTIRLSWSPTSCNPSANPLMAYKIYRKDDCDSVTFDPCQTGVPSASGYQFIASVSPTVISFIDDNNKDGLVVGQNYSYLIIAEYKDGSQSLGSSQVCSKLKRDVPLILNVDVLSTSASGSVQIKWSKPLTTPGNFDPSAFPGPYQFSLKHRVGTANFVEVFNSTKANFIDLDESYIHSDINTLDDKHEYIIDFIAGTVTIGSSQRATSVFLNTAPTDRRIDLSWSSKTPWNNYQYEVYRKDPASTSYTMIATTAKTSYSDENGVENKKQYCYYVKSQGEYSDPTITKPLINNSQEACATATDIIPPCPPTLTVEANCPTGFVKIGWDDVTKLKCGDDVVKYILFYKPTVGADYIEVTSGAINSYIYDGLELISGCYAVKAIDITGNVGQLSPDFCIDNCPEFELPNVFSPNDDGANDTYHAIKVRQIKEILLTITDRWGNMVYKTNDPYFKWNGTSIVTKQPVSEGTFFYVCQVFEPHLQGISKRTLKGYLQVVR